MSSIFDIATLEHFMQEHPGEWYKVTGDFYALEPIPPNARVKVEGNFRGIALGPDVQLKADGVLELHDVGVRAKAKGASVNVTGTAEAFSEVSSSQGDVLMNHLADDCFVKSARHFYASGTVGARPHIQCAGENFAFDKTEPANAQPHKHASHTKRHVYGAVDLGGGITRDRLGKCFVIQLESTITQELCDLIAKIKTFVPDITVIDGEINGVQSYLIKEGNNAARNDAVTDLLVEYGLQQKRKEECLR